MDFWSPEQTKKFIGIEQAFEEFCEADPKLGKLDSTRPDLKRSPKKFNKWYYQYCRARDEATSRFIEPFREKSLVAIVQYDDMEKVLPPEYWDITVASLTITKGKVQGLPYDGPDRHLENSRVVLRREEWEKWTVAKASQYKVAQKKSRYEKWAGRQQKLVSSKKAKDLREAASLIADENGVDWTYVERETRRVREERAGKSGKKK